MWKTSVETQEHFNDIEWRIRGLALTVATFALGAAGVAAKDGTKIWVVSLGSLVLVLGLVLWYAFYFVDRFWYHPLLKAAVDEGTELEKAIGRYLPDVHMTAGITARSPQRVSRVVKCLAGRKGTSERPAREDGGGGIVYVMHSDQKLRWFYRVGASTFIVGIIALQVAAFIAPAPTPPEPVIVQIQTVGPTPTTAPSPTAVSPHPSVSPSQASSP